MREILFCFLLLPFVSMADGGNCHLEQVGGGDWRIVCEGSGLQFNYVDVTNEVFVFENCDNLKSSLRSSLEYIEGQALLSQQKSSEALQTSQTAKDIVIQVFEGVPPGEFNNTWNNLNLTIHDIFNYSGNIIDQSRSLKSTIDDINCGSCSTNGVSGGGSSGSGGGSCCDFTPIIDRLIVSEKLTSSISNQLVGIQYYIGSITNQLAYNNFLLEHGFGEITNLLSYVQYDSPQRWTLNPSSGLNGLYGLRTTSNGTQFQTFPFSVNTVTVNAQDYGWLPSLWWQNIEQMRILASLNSFEMNKYLNFNGTVTNSLISLKENFDTYSDVTTNALTALTDSTTNFFSFFYQATAPAEGVIADYTVQEADGTYYTFLTNYYITVNEGGSLTGMLVDKTNWFYRVEALLAALVFADAPSTNVVDVDSDEYDKQKNQLEEMFDELNGSLDEPTAALTEINDSMIQSLTDLSQSFSSAAIPSHIELLSVAKDSGSGSLSKSSTSFDVEFMVENDINDLFEIFHSLTTLAWLFVSLLVIYKFLVWSINKAVLVIRFIWNVAEMFMSRNG